MDRPYVEWVRVEGYRCIKSADLHLTRLHALIGPNDSGKISLLRAMSVSEYGRAKGKLTGTTSLGTFGGPVLRLDPDSIRLPAHLIAQGVQLWFRDEKGAGTPALYDALLSRDIAAFSRINSRFVALFPTVRSLRLHNNDSTRKQLGLTLLDGTEVGPEEMSEGMLSARDQ